MCVLIVQISPATCRSETAGQSETDAQRAESPLPISPVPVREMHAPGVREVCGPRDVGVTPEAVIR